MSNYLDEVKLEWVQHGEVWQDRALITLTYPHLFHVNLVHAYLDGVLPRPFPARASLFE